MMKVSLKNIAETLKVPFDMVQWNPLLFGNAVKMLNIPIESKKGHARCAGKACVS